MAVKKGSGLSRAEQAFVNTRISSETFRYRFLDHNRLWLVQNLATLLSPRTLRRSRPYLIGVLSKVLNAVEMDVPTKEALDVHPLW
jgi:hypothetical protein